MNIFTLLQMSADCYPERIAVTCGDMHISYTELRDAALVAAGQFRESGCEYVSVLAESSPAVPIALFGAAAAGLPYVPLNYRLSPDQLDALLARIQPLFLITEDSRDSFIKDCLAGSGTDTEIPEEGEAIAVQLFTSGTTGEPKAALLRHQNLIAYILGTVEFGIAGEEEANLVTVPPYHIAGISAVISSIYAGRRLVQLPGFDPAQWLELARSENVTNAFLVPTMLKRVIDHIETIDADPDLPALRALAYGGGKMPLPVIQSALAMWPNVAFTNAYGLTETSSTVALLGPEEHREALSSDDEWVRRRLTSVGKPLPSIEVQIRDDAGRTLAANESGEIFLRGEQVSGEYRERSTLDGEGWFPTRDAGYLDEHGYLYLDGRADDVIVRGGENISPGEVEDVLLSHSALADVCVTSVPDEEWGEAVAAVVVLKSGQKVEKEELRDLVRQKLRSSRVPSRIEFAGELPYNEMGKLLRREVILNN